MTESLVEAPRLVVEADLTPLVGSTFQPTGFPDLGAARFRLPDGRDALIVESVQSLTNHFEALGWDAAQQEPIPLLASLPYVRVVHTDDARFLTSSRLEPHRLASAYVRDATIDREEGTAWIAARLGLEPGRPLGWPEIYSAIFQLDPLCLIHGVFFSDVKWHGNPKVRRALSAVIEARGAAPVISGGLKRDDVQIKSAEGRGAEEGYGFVPFGREEFVADEIKLIASVDLEQIRGYGLGEAETRLLSNLAMWELSSLLSRPLRLRTACDLEVTAVTARRPEGADLPDPHALAQEIESHGVEFDQPGAREARWPKATGKP